MLPEKMSGERGSHDRCESGAQMTGTLAPHALEKTETGLEMTVEVCRCVTADLGHGVTF